MLFKILHGDASRISTEITPYHEGYCYVTHDGYFYVDMNNERVKLNANEANKLIGYDISTVINDSDVEIPVSSAVFKALAELETNLVGEIDAAIAEITAIPDSEIIALFSS